MLNKKIGEILTSKIVSVSPETSVSEAISVMKENLISCILVVRDKKPIGIFTERDIIRAANRNNITNLKVEELMSNNLITVREDTTIYEAYGILERNKIRHLIIEDAKGDVIGLVTLTDIINNLGIEYFLALKSVSEIMTADVKTLKRKDDNVADAISMMADHSISCIIIEEDRVPVGIITERGISHLLMEGDDKRALNIEKVMSHPVYTISNDAPVYEVAKVFKEKRVRRLVVVDSKGMIAGLVTQTDIVKGLKGKYTDLLMDIIREQEKRLMEAGESLMESEKKYRTLVDNALVGIYTSNLKGDILFVNNAVVKMSEFDSAEEFISGGAVARYKNLEERKTLIETLKKTGKIEGFEIEMLTKTGNTKYALVTARLDGDIISGMIVDITDRKNAEKERDELIYNLRSALVKIKRLSGLLPICASCKKIRDDKGYWKQVEKYIREHSEADFTHTICPDCAKKLYPDFINEKGDEGFKG